MSMVLRTIPHSPRFVLFPLDVKSLRSCRLHSFVLDLCLRIQRGACYELTN